MYSIAWFSIGATLGQDQWIEENVEGEEKRRRIYRTVDSLFDEDKPTWQKWMEVAKEFDANPDIKFPNTKEFKSFRVKLHKQLVKAGVTGYKIHE